MTQSAPRRDTPFRINLEQQQKRAKELLKALRSADSTALSRFNQHHPKLSAKHIKQTIKLSDAQLVIARELGLPSWAKLKTHITLMTQASDAIKKQSNTPDSNTPDIKSPDAEFKTLHIRCGSDLASTLPAAGFSGEFLEYSDPYGQGPIIQDENFIPTRAKFLAESYGQFLDINLNDTFTKLKTADDKLRHATKQYERIVLWFEHDGYDQLILAKLLTFYAEDQIPKKLEMVTLNVFPGSARFIGMGQLPPEAIRLIWQQRKAINSQQLELGKKVWFALGEPTPLPLYEIYQSKDVKHLPNMKGALLRHFQELPSTNNGLSLTEQITLEILNKEDTTTSQLFRQLMRERDPLPWLGDVMYWFILQSMMQASQAVFEISKEDLGKPWHERLLSITDTGKDVLAGTKNWLILNPSERWLGGVKISPGHSYWCWDEQQHLPELHQN